MVCGHQIESENVKIPCEKNYGNYKFNYNTGMIIKRDPCENCIADGKWVRDVNNKWVKA
jgi:hypothetical protein